MATADDSPPDRKRPKLGDLLGGEAQQKSLHDHIWATPQKGERHRTAMVTWSRPKNVGFRSVPREKSECLRDVANAFGEVFEGSPDSVSIGVWHEPHSDGETHAHIVIKTTAETKAFFSLAGMLGESRIAADVRVPLLDGHSDKFLHVMRYLNAPTANKCDIDLEPCLARMKIPVTIEKEQKAFRSLETRPATRNEMFDLLCSDGTNRVVTLADLDATCQSRIADPSLRRSEKICYLRAKNWVSKEGKAAKSEFAFLAERRFKLAKSDLIKQPFSYFHGRASRADCECCESGAFFEQLKGCVEFHDGREKNDGDREAANHLGAYFRMLLQNKFDERFQSLLVIGKKRTGKTTVMKAVVNCFGPDAEWAVFQPAWDDSYPFSGFDPDLVKIIDMNDLRLEACNRTTMLNLLERKAGMRLAIKGETSVVLPHEEGRMPYTIITSNDLSPVRNFSEVDVAALLDRVYPQPRGLFWGKKLPRSFLAKYDQNALACRCQRCAAKFVTWLAEGDREQPVATKGEQPPNTTAKREEQPKDAGAIGAAMKPEKDNRADDSFEAEFDFWGVLCDLD